MSVRCLLIGVWMGSMYLDGEGEVWVVVWAVWVAGIGISGVANRR